MTSARAHAGLRRISHPFGPNDHDCDHGGSTSSGRENRMSTVATFTRSPWNGNASVAEREQWIGVAARLAASLAPTALQRDRDNALPREELKALRDAGLINLLVPTEFGGSGAHWETAFGVVREIARADASLGILLGYHYLNQA